MAHIIMMIVIAIVSWFAFPPWEEIPGRFGKQGALFVGLMLLLWIAGNTQRA